MEENKSIQLNTTPPMPPIPLLPSQLVVTTIFNSIESLGFTNIAGKVFPGEQAESRQEANLKVSTQKFYTQGLKNLEEQDLHGAIKNFTATININPLFASAYNDRGVARYKLGYKQSAIEDLTTAIELNPYRAKYYSNRGFMLTRLKDYTAAIADYNSALLLNPNVAHYYFDRGAIRLKMENSLAALADFESAIRLDSDFAKAYFNRGVTRYKLREVHGAFEDFQKAAGLFKLQGRMDSYQDAVSKISQLWY
ncbi:MULTISPECIES: tetratricopeptide repeat protein [unclassified Microcoleus]|uniref:tetratricopeptide repeat protein n=1 Tax=unclassified Microcoleus TaxID=2642155 RepID=UPI002FD321E0